MRKFWTGIVVSALLLTAACNFHASSSQANSELNGRAEELYHDLVAGRDDAIVAAMSKENSAAQVRAQLPTLRNFVADGPPPAAIVAGTQTTRSTDGSFYTVLQTYDYADRVVRFEVRFKAEDGEWKVLAFNLNVVIKPGAEGADQPEGAAPSA
jgi:hypothetical protein